MNVTNLKCNRCGSPNVEHIGQGMYHCKNCDAQFPMSYTGNDESITTKLSRIYDLRNKLKFDECEEIIDSILLESNHNENLKPLLGDVYFQKFLCDYGVCYVDEDGSPIQIPTLNRLSPTSCFENANYINARNNYSNKDAKEKINQAVSVIENIRSKAFEKVLDEDPYDVFISLKVRTLDGKGYTSDDKVARDIYDKLTKNGYRVFYSEETLKQKAGSEYEPIIYHALFSAKVFLLICTDDVEYIKQPWVQNEWSRFLKRRELEQDLAMVSVITSKIKIELMPSKLARLQALNYDPSFYQNLDIILKQHVHRTLKSNLNKKEINVSIKPISVAQVKIEKTKFGANKEKIVFQANEEILLTSALQQIDRMCITKSKNEKKKFHASAFKILDEILKLNIQNYQAYWYKYLCANEASDDKKLIRDYQTFTKEQIDSLEFIKLFFEYAPEDIALEKLKILLEQLKCLIKANDGHYISLPLYECLLSYMGEKDELNMTQLIKEKVIDSLAMKRLNDFNLLNKISETIYPVLTKGGAKRVISYYDDVSRVLRGCARFNESKIYQDKALELFEADPDALWNKLCLEFKITNRHRYNVLLKTKKGCDATKQTIEKMLSGGYKIRNTDLNYVNMVVNLCISNLKINVKNACSLFLDILAILPNAKEYTDEDEYNEYFSMIVNNFSNKCLLLGQFDTVRQLSNELISQKLDTPETHWNLLKAENKMHTNYDLLVSKKDFTDDTELYNNILIRSIDDKNNGNIPQNIIRLRDMIYNSKAKRKIIKKIKQIIKLHIILFKDMEQETLQSLAQIGASTTDCLGYFETLYVDYNRKVMDAKHDENSLYRSSANKFEFKQNFFRFDIVYILYDLFVYYTLPAILILFYCVYCNNYFISNAAQLSIFWPLRLGFWAWFYGFVPIVFALSLAAIFWSLKNTKLMKRATGAKLITITVVGIGVGAGLYYSGIAGLLFDLIPNYENAVYNSNALFYNMDTGIFMIYPSLLLGLVLIFSNVFGRINFYKIIASVVITGVILFLAIYFHHGFVMI